jgi:hypothetical protein
MKKIDCGGERAKFCRERKMNPSRCQKGSFRTIRRGKATLVICRPKGKTSTRVQTILHKKTSRACAACRR